LLLSTGYAFAGAGAPAPEKPAGGPPSGRPGAVLDESKCGAVWSAAGGSDTLTYDKAGPYVTNMQAADPDNDGKFTKTEFMDACKKGLVQEKASKPGETGGGQTPEQPTKP
jgi:hypothetical protein